MTNDQAREKLYHARLYLLQRVSKVVDSYAIRLLMDIEMGLAHNVSMPGRGI